MGKLKQRHIPLMNNKLRSDYKRTKNFMLYRSNKKLPNEEEAERSEKMKLTLILTLPIKKITGIYTIIKPSLLYMFGLVRGYVLH